MIDPALHQPAPSDCPCSAPRGRRYVPSSRFSLGIAQEVRGGDRRLLRRQLDHDRPDARLDPHARRARRGGRRRRDRREHQHQQEAAQRRYEPETQHGLTSKPTGPTCHFGGSMVNRPTRLCAAATRPSLSPRLCHVCKRGHGLRAHAPIRAQATECSRRAGGATMRLRTSMRTSPMAAALRHRRRSALAAHPRARSQRPTAASGIRSRRPASIAAPPARRAPPTRRTSRSTTASPMPAPPAPAPAAAAIPMATPPRADRRARSPTPAARSKRPSARPLWPISPPPAGLSPGHFHRLFKARDRPHPARLCRRPPRRPRPRRTARRRHRHGGDLRRRLRLERPLLRRVAGAARHDARRATAPAARGETLRFAVGQCTLGAILVASSEAGRRRDPARRRSRRCCCATCRIAFPPPR